MSDAIFVAPWPWWIAGPALGLVVTLVAWIGGKALGVSTAYGAVCALGSRAPFFRAREYQERWRLAFVIGLPLGGFVAVAWPAAGASPRASASSMSSRTIPSP